MKSIGFPNILNNVSTNSVDDYYATLQNIKLLLFSEKGELFGDPYYGTNLRKFLFDQNDLILQDILLDDIYTALALFIPQIKVNRNDIKLIKSGNGSLSLSIKALNKASFTTDMFNIVLLQAEV